MHSSSTLLERSIATTNIKNAHPKVQGAVLPDYVPHKDPTDNIEAVIHLPHIEPPMQPKVAIKCNTDIKIPEDTTIDLSNIPEMDVVKESEKRNIVSDAVVAADEQKKIDDSDIPQANSATNYFLDKIAQFGDLYDDQGQNPVVGRRIQALSRYFRDPTSTSKKWSNDGDIVIYGGLNTGVKFSSYLECIVTPPSRRPKVLPPYFSLLISQITPFINEEEVDKTSTGQEIFAQATPAAQLPDADVTEEQDDANTQFIKNISIAYKHSAANAKQCAVFAFCGAFLPASARELELLVAHLDEIITRQVALQKTVDTDRKQEAIIASRKRTATQKAAAKREIIREELAKRLKLELAAIKKEEERE